MESNGNHIDSLRQMLDYLEGPPWLTGTQKHILLDDVPVPNTTVDSLDPLAPENDNCFGPASPAKDPEGMAGCNACSAQQTPPGSGCQPIHQPPCTANGGQYKGMPSLPARPPKARPTLPTAPTTAPEPPSAPALADLQPMNMDDHDTQLESGEIDNAMERKSGDTETEGLRGAAPSASKDAAGDVAQEPAQAADPNADVAQQAAAQRPALTECTLIGFDWKGSRQKLHVLREEGADCLSGAVMVTQLRKVPLPKPAWSPKMVCRTWNDMARALKIRSRGAASWVSTKEEQEALEKHGAFCFRRGCRAVRMLLVTVALEELGRVCKGYEDDLASLRAALTAGQPASPAGSGEELSGHHAESNPCSNAPLAALCQKAKLPKEASPALSHHRTASDFSPDCERAARSAITTAPTQPPAQEATPYSKHLPERMYGFSGADSLPHLTGIKQPCPSDDAPAPKQASRRGTASKKRRPTKMRRTAETPHHDAQAESAPHTNGGYTEAQYRAHMNLRKDALARLGSVWVQEDMAFAAAKDAQIEKLQREVMAMQKLCAELRASAASSSCKAAAVVLARNLYEMKLQFDLPLLGQRRASSVYVAASEADSAGRLYVDAVR
ncbi:g382 [Coccomyxa viridis]|uniref:G382 protein n=1 Tax=Coccomyxa viridis TaxID=1274662 RepID=A0ABP1FFK1_9CHLO